MNKIEGILNRLYKVLNIDNDAEFAKKYSIKRNTLSTWKKRDSIPYELLETISQNENISMDWLLFGEKENNISNKNTYNIDKLSIIASAGSGIQNYEISKIGTIQIPTEFFKTPQNPNNLKAIQVEGDSMEPTIKDGSFIIIDTTKTNPIDGIYAIMLHDEILIKRLQFNLNGTIEIISDNKAYTTKTYNPKETDINFKILGKKILTIQ